MRLYLIARHMDPYFMSTSSEYPVFALEAYRNIIHRAVSKRTPFVHSVVAVRMFGCSTVKLFKRATRARHADMVSILLTAETEPAAPRALTARGIAPLYP